MRKILVSIGVCTLVSSGIQAQDVPASKVGKIYVIGNEKVGQREIRRDVGLYPGQSLVYPSLRDAEEKLATSGSFVVDPAKGVRPTVTVIEDTDSVFKDIVINVQEVRPVEQILPEPQYVTPQPRRTGILGRLIPMRRR